MGKVAANTGASGRGGVSENTTFYVFSHGKDGAFEAFPISDWYRDSRLWTRTRRRRENHPDLCVKMSAVAAMQQSTPNVVSEQRNLTAS